MNEHYREYYENRGSVWIISITIAVVCLFGVTLSWHRLEVAHTNELRVVQTQTEKRAETMNTAVEQYVEMTLISIDNTLRQLRLAYLANPKAFDQTAQEAIQNLPAGLVQFVTVFGANGDLLYSSNGATGRFNIQDREHFTVHAQSQADTLFISAPIVGRISKTPIIQLTRPIWSKEGQFLGVIGLPLRPDFVAEQLNDLHMESTDVISIVRMDGSFVSRSRNLWEALASQVPSQRPYLSASPKESGLFRDKSCIDPVPMIFSWRRMNRWPLAVVVGVDESTQLLALQEKRQEERKQMMMVIAAIVLLTIAIIALVQRMARRNFKLHESQYRFQQLFEKNQTILRNASDGICIVNADGCVTEASDSFCTMLGYKHDAIIGLHVTRWDIQYSPEEIRKAIHRVLGNDKWMSKRIELNSFYRSCEGRVMPVEVSVIPFSTQQEKLLFCTIRDTTARKNAQLSLEMLNNTLQTRSAEAEAANRAKSAFLTTMSHEIRTPLNAIIGMGYLLQQSVLEAQQQEQVRAIQVAGNNLLELVNNVLDVSKIEAGATVLESIPVSLFDVCDEMRLLFATAAQNKGLIFHIQPLDACIPSVILGDPVRLKQMLTNLLGNAVKFTKQGTIQLRIRLADTPEKLRFEINDTGIGITPQQQERLFKPFSQADVSTTRQYGGTGLGLSIVRQLAELMGGAAGIESVLGQGSTFWFEIVFQIPSVTAAVKTVSLPSITAVTSVPSIAFTNPTTLTVSMPLQETTLQGDDLAKIRSLVAALENMLVENRIDALSLSHEIGTALRGTPEAAFYQTVAQCVAMLQYDKARAEIEMFKEKLCTG